jgi:hypothetical protein
MQHWTQNIPVTYSELSGSPASCLQIPGLCLEFTHQVWPSITQIFSISSQHFAHISFTECNHTIIHTKQQRFTLNKQFWEHCFTDHSLMIWDDVSIRNFDCPKPIHILIDEFFIGNQEKCQTNSSVHNINTRNKHHLHRPVANLSCFQKCHPTLGSEFLTAYHEVLQILRMKRHNLK